MIKTIADSIIEDSNTISEFLKDIRVYLQNLYRSNPFRKVRDLKSKDLVSVATNSLRKSDIDNFVDSRQLSNFNVIIDKLNTQNSVESSYNLARKFLNSNIGNLIKSGPNLLTNMYDVYLSIENNYNSDEYAFLILSTEIDATEVDENKSISKDINVDEMYKDNRVKKSLIEDSYSLSVRNASISIPQRRINNSTIPFEGTDISIALSEWTMDNEANLNITLDANLYMFDIFNSLAGLVRRSYKVKDNVKIDNNRKIMAPNGIGNNDIKIDLYVSVHNLSGFSNIKVDPYFNTGSNILYQFEDIKFLGTNNDIEFDSSSSTSKTVTVPFIFKSLNTINKVDTNTKPNKEDNFKFDSNYSSNISKFSNLWRI